MIIWAPCPITAMLGAVVYVAIRASGHECRYRAVPSSKHRGRTAVQPQDVKTWPRLRKHVRFRPVG